MEVAGLVIGAVSLVSLWNNCLQAFETIETVRNYGLDYEVLRVKLEVERIRLVVWGETVGLNTLQIDKRGIIQRHTLDPRLNKREVEITVVNLLGCMYAVFRSTDAFKKRYGLKKESSLGVAFNRMSLLGRTTDPSRIDGTSLMLETVFQRAYTTLQQSATENKKSTSFARKAKWAINDKAKFQTLITEIREYNDSLASLFPDIGARAASRIKEEIEASDDIRRLQLVQEAASDEHEDISDAASVRLINLGATLLSDVPDIAPPIKLPEPNKVAFLPKASNSSATDGARDEEPLDPALLELQKTMEDLEKFVRKMERGSIVCRLSGPYDWTSRCSASTYWTGDESDRSSWWDERSKGYAILPHSAFSVYHRKKYIKKARYDKYDTPTDEDYVFLDVEGDPKYHHVIPGTVTVEGFGLDCWEYQEHFGKKHDQTILISYADTPNLPGKKVLRRLDELRRGGGRLGWNPKADYEDLKEFAGTGGHSYVNPEDVYKASNQIMDLYRLLNRRDIFANFVQVSSIGAMVLSAHPDSPGMWNVLWQFILGKELARRLDNFPDMSMSGFTARIMTTLIATDLWMNNVEIVLVPIGKEAGEPEAKKDDTPPTDKDGNDAWDEAFSLEGKSMQFHSIIHERQVEGLLRFAELMKWPFINETREFAEDVYANLRGGTTVPIDLWDWLFGLVLPGKWASFKIMAALVLCTPSLTETLGVSAYFDGGLSLPKQSYWRSRTVLGRVLSSLPGVKSICGWVGPCPVIEGPTIKYIRLKARRVAPPATDDIIRVGGYGPDDGEESSRPRKDEDIQAYIAEIKDDSNWSIPEPPVLQMSVCALESIRLKALPLDADIVANNTSLSPKQIENETEYRASLTFQVDNETPTTYTLFTNPVFISAPPCHEGPHRVHSRELPKFQRNVWNVQDLKDAAPDDYETKDLLVINAIGKGAEILAKAWCSERGKNALIRMDPGPCYTCAYNSASSKGLGVGVLIWVS